MHTDLHSSGMKKLIRPTLVITFFSLAAQAIGFLTQILIAAYFGARPDMDAFLAANTLPQYVIAVCLNALGFVFIPIFIEYFSNGRQKEALEIAGSVIGITTIVLFIMALIGMIFARSLLELTTPGLSQASLKLAVKIAWITWPTVIVNGLVSLVSSIYQAQGRFNWQAVAPVFGAFTNFILVALLGKFLGVVGIAIANTAGLCIQLTILIIIGRLMVPLKTSINWNHEGVKRIFSLIVPIVISGFLIRWTPIIDRFLASNLAEGSIAHLGYVIKLLGLLSIIISSGIATVIFPRMAFNISSDNFHALTHTFSTGFNVMWMLIAPVISIGFILAFPVVYILFMRQAFTLADVHAVSLLLKIYLISLVGSGLGNMTGRLFYSLKDTRTTSIVGVFEAIAYAVYTPLLTRWLGIIGIAVGFVIYNNLSIAWQLPVLRWKIKRKGGHGIMVATIKTSIAAAVAGMTAWGLSLWVSNYWLQVFLCGTGGIVVYVFCLIIGKQTEVLALRTAFTKR